MSPITLNDLQFSISITAEEIQRQVAEMAARINKDLAGKNPLFLAVLNGSFMFAADLLRNINTPSEICFVRLASYEGLETTGTVKELLGLTEDIEGRTVVVIEDIIDSGFTMQKLLADLRQKKPAELRLAALLVKPGNLQVELDIDYNCFSIPNDFIVGYGLDYNGFGRNLPAIYTVVNTDDDK